MYHLSLSTAFIILSPALSYMSWNWPKYHLSTCLSKSIHLSDRLGWTLSQSKMLLFLFFFLNLSVWSQISFLSGNYVWHNEGSAITASMLLLQPDFREQAELIFLGIDTFCMCQRRKNAKTKIFEKHIFQKYNFNHNSYFFVYLWIK